jgi:hypothetical protein
MSNSTLERLIYAAVIVLCVIALVLVAFSPSLDTDTRVVYQGF